MINDKYGGYNCGRVYEELTVALTGKGEGGVRQAQKQCFINK